MLDQNWKWDKTKKLLILKNNKTLIATQLFTEYLLYSTDFSLSARCREWSSDGVSSIQGYVSNSILSDEESTSLNI